ncbi:NAD(P)H-quinone oxidoreductase [Rubrolithibacter danxiaensis]|uniref:NAD(P)H-quinone oxidoreductase n=1 Tax=Rubrolithibacter danxiaensis TaxID=3390805 RepID=UPI003BF80FCD
MKAIVISEKGGPEVLKLQEVPVPVPLENEVLIKIKAAGVNRSDILSRSSKSYSSEALEIPGLEISGIVTATGNAVKRWKTGDQVCALIVGGGYAEYKAIDERLCLPVPAGLSLAEAASLPETIFTVWFNVFKICGFKAGENFLVHGGSSGIGVAAIQMVVAMGGTAYATAGTEEKCTFCEKLGARKAINYKNKDFEEELKEVGIDVILDMTGGENTLKNLRIMKQNGRISFINAMIGSKSEIDIRFIMSKQLQITGSMLKPQKADFKAGLAFEVEKYIWPLISNGKIKPIIYKTFKLEEAAEAHQLMESSKHIGKILLTTD